MKSLLLLFVMLAFLACSSTSSTDPQTIIYEEMAENNPGELLNQVDGELDKLEQIEEVESTGETEEVEEVEVEDEDEDGMDDYYRSIPKPKSDAELKLLENMNSKAEEAELAFFGSNKLSNLLENLEMKEDEGWMPLPDALSEPDFTGLTLKEKIYYSLAYKEKFMQICTIIMFNAGKVKAIADQMPFSDDALFASNRQYESLKADLPSTQKLFVQFLDEQNKVSTRMLSLIAELKLNACIPELINIYRNQTTKNDLILTALVELMNRSTYKVWTESKLSKEFGENSHGVVKLNKMNADQILMYAGKFSAMLRN